jgi:hypothetical protein
MKQEERQKEKDIKERIFQMSSLHTLSIQAHASEFVKSNLTTEKKIQERIIKPIIKWYKFINYGNMD